MRRAKVYPFIVVSGVLVAAAVTASAAPLPLTYQGKLTQNGSPYNGTADFRCSLYASESGGSPLMDFSTVVGATVVNGLFTIELAWPVDPATVLGTSPRWLHIQVAVPSGGSFVDLSPRQLLTPAPLAQFALATPAGSGPDGHSLDAVDGSPVDAVFVDADGKVQLNHGGLSVFDAHGHGVMMTSDVFSFNEAASLDPVYHYSSATDKHTFYAGGASVATIDSSGRLGIGTTSPTQRLDVAGTVKATGFQLGTSATAGHVLTANASGVGTWQAPPAGSTSPWTISGSEIYYNTGQVGVGTAGPNSMLHVNGDGVDPSLRVQVSGSSKFIVASNGGVSVGANQTTPPENGVYVNGKVGIGTTTPRSSLDTFDAISTGSSGSPGSVTFYPPDGYAWFHIDNGPDGSRPTGRLRFSTGGSPGDNEHMSILQDGNVGIGVTDPSSKLDVVTSSGDAIEARSNGTGAGTSAISAYIDNASSDSDTYAGYFSADGSNGYAIYATSDYNSTVRADCDYYYGHAFYGLSDGNGGGYFSTSKTGGYGVKGKGANGPGVYAECNGTGTTRSALYVENTNSGGIGIVSTVTSTDANSVIVNKGAGDLIKGFSGASGGDLVFQVENDGHTTVSVLTITGGSDLAEKFDVVDEAKPGMVVEIDPDNAGKLRIARGGAYNRRVAGVISGANDVDAGMILADLPGAKNSMPVALTGRTWVFCDATEKAVEPGDMLTTGEKPGHAMPVIDHDRANGAVIGKAMSELDKGQTGMVLALVNLQ